MHRMPEHDRYHLVRAMKKRWDEINKEYQLLTLSLFNLDTVNKVCTYVWVYVCMCVCVYVCMCRPFFEDVCLLFQDVLFRMCFFVASVLVFGVHLCSLL
jgi:hypothetical protein